MRRYKLQDRNRQRFLKVPKDLIFNAYYRENLNSTSKLVYSMLLDRMELSRKNEWVNDNDEIYLLYTKKNIAKELNISERTVYKCFNSLEDVDLIEQERQGLNQPNKIFIGKTDADKAGKSPSQPDVQKSSGPDMNRPAGQDLQDMQGSETECIETDVNETKKETYISPAKEARIEGLESMNIYLNLFNEYIGGKHGNVTQKVYNEASAILEENYCEWDEDNFIGTLREYFEDESRSGLPKLSYFVEVSDRFFL